MDPAPVLSTALRVLTGTATRDTLLRLDHRHLAFGLVATWLAGIGRYWDHPHPHLLQVLGVGSLIYVFVLTTFLWLVVWPLRPADGSWRRLLTYVALTSPPALLYAIPVERFMSLEAARAVNAWFLAIVAVWRVGLLAVYLLRSARLPVGAAIVGLLLPLASIVVVLAAANLEQAAFQLMAGVGESARATPADGAYFIVWLLAVLSVLGFVPILGAYLFAVVIRRRAPASGACPTASAAAATSPPSASSTGALLS